MIESIKQWASEFAHPDIVFESCVVGDFTDELGELEQDVLNRSSGVRRSSFSSGRHCAKSALRQLGIEASSFSAGLAQNADGSVAWPGDVIGSLSHTTDWAVAGVASQTSIFRSFGVDIERIDRLDKRTLKIIATDEEQHQLTELPDLSWGAIALFSVKESVYKCLRPILGEFIGFKAVGITGFAVCEPRPALLPAFYTLQISLRSPELQQRFSEQQFYIRVGLLEEHVISFVGYTHQAESFDR